MISDNEPIVSKFISTPKDMTQLNCASFLSGLVEGMLDAAEFVRIAIPVTYLMYSSLFTNTDMMHAF
jgi:hypothetical protein